MTGMVVTCNKVQRIFYIKKIKIRKFKELFSVSHKKKQFNDTAMQNQDCIKSKSPLKPRLVRLYLSTIKVDLYSCPMLESIKLYAQE